MPGPPSGPRQKTSRRTELSAYEEGKEAFRQGKPQTANPYHPADKEHAFLGWDDGWNDAYDEQTKENRNG